MDNMFELSAFNQPINYNSVTNAWNTAKVIYMSNTFNSAAVFNQNISAWTTANVTSMDGMFNNATVFNQNISAWNVALVTPVPPTNFRTGSALVGTNVPAAFYPAASLSGFSVASKTFGDASFELTAPSSNSDGAFTYTSSEETVATISGSTVTIVGAGTTTITATQAATFNYNTNFITASFVVAQATPSLSNFSVASKTVNDAPFALTAPSSNSSGAFTYESSNVNVATISGSTVTIVGAGTTTITAIQAATATYASNSISATLTVIGPNWNQRGLDIDGEASIDLSGWSVSISSDGSVVAIGATGNDGNDTDSGHVRVYAWNGTAWVQRGLDINGEAAGNNSGQSVSISSDGNVVAIGAHRNDGNGNSAGHVRVYVWNGTAWVQRGLDIDGEAANNYSGWSVSISSDGKVVAIGAYGNDGNGSDAGHVRVYAWNETAWVQRGLDIDGEAADDYSGYSVSISSDGKVVAIGAYGNDGNGSDAGYVRVYAWNETAWVQRGLDIEGEAADDNSGKSVSISSDGNVVAIGAPGNDGNGSDAGHVRVYAWNGTAWVQRGLDIDGEAASDRSGWSVSISSDGNVVAIGATGNDGNGNSAGHVRVYAWNGTAWVQRGLDIDGEAADDNSGFSVSISSDGNVVAIGAPGNNGYNGHVRVYYYSSPSLSNFSVASKTVGDVPFTLTAPSSNSAGAFTYTSSDETVATISGSTVTIVGAGTTTITAIQAATNDYIAGKITASFVVNPEPE
jgi:hypothetical protein